MHAASLIIPEGMAPHWQGEGNDETDTYHLIWALIDGSYVDQETLDVCLASEGKATAVYGF